MGICVTVPILRMQLRVSKGIFSGSAITAFCIFKVNCPMDSLKPPAALGLMGRKHT